MSPSLVIVPSRLSFTRNVNKAVRRKSHPIYTIHPHDNRATFTFDTMSRPAMSSISRGLLDLPLEILYHILSYTLDDEKETWISCSEKDYTPPRYIPLACFKGWSDSCQRYSARSRGEVLPRCSSIPHFSLTSRGMHQALQQYLATQCQFLITVNMAEKAPSHVNAFSRLHALDPTFRTSIKHIVVLMGVPMRPFIEHYFPARWGSKVYWKDLELYERMVENLVELVETLPGLASIHLEWGFLAGNGGMQNRLVRLSQSLFRRLREEAYGRQMKLGTFSAQSVMGYIPDRTQSFELPTHYTQLVRTDPMF